MAIVLTHRARRRSRKIRRINIPTSDAWQWGVEGNVFAGYNYQYRKFTDFDEIESQNWLMTSLSKTFGDGSNLEFVGMFSLEPFTLRDIGSPQVFQTGETFGGAPLIDYQHPHDLIMNLGASTRAAFGATQRDDCRVCRRPRADRAAGVHAPAVGDRESAGAALASLSRCDAHHAGRRLDRRRAIRIRPRSGRVSRPGAG